MELKPCPFCNSSLLDIELRVPVWGASTPENIVICNDCAASAPDYVWNQRKTEGSANQAEPSSCV